MNEKNSHPEQDPAEGSRAVIDRELEREEKKPDAGPGKSGSVGEGARPKGGDHRPM